MRAGVTLLAAASLLLASCSSDETESVTDPTTEPTVADLRLASGSFTVGNPVLETPPKFHEAPTEFVPESPFGISDVQVDGGRAVFTFFGEGVVNYVGRYTPAAESYDGNVAVDVPGTSILQVDLISSPSPDRTDDRHIAADGDIRAVVTTDPTDGVTQAFLGTEAERPDFTITTQQEPPALIVTVTDRAV